MFLMFCPPINKLLGFEFDKKKLKFGQSALAGPNMNQSWTSMFHKFAQHSRAQYSQRKVSYSIVQ
jgi:hypothetical protein